MLIRYINPLGYCDSVKNSIKQAMSIREKGIFDNIYIFGMLAHNELLVEKLADYKIQTIVSDNFLSPDILDNITHKDAVILPSHGHFTDLTDELTRRQIRYFDLTCPYITKINHSLLTLDPKKKIIYIGKMNHTEATESFKYIKNDKFFIDYKNFSLNKIPFFVEDNIVITNQSSLSGEMLKDIISQIKTKFINIEILDHTCKNIEYRIKQTEYLTKFYDKTIILGSIHSSNANSILKAANSANGHSYLINSLEELVKIRLKNDDKILVVSSTSFPSNEVDKIINYLDKLW